ncbi:unnamed protein product [Cyprideis torosa]|uniref:Uncharacterized protein n=1 Tax=Cyprideis torosa TaxID=163714 RepID=A0A7R8WP40_9CRUS|nr:unnamed protein product [Cyprideis torosa]CAG0901358.1 unnamed protein product [Cyprideis torosa]
MSRRLRQSALVFIVVSRVLTFGWFSSVLEGVEVLAVFSIVLVQAVLSWFIQYGLPCRDKAPAPDDDPAREALAAANEQEPPGPENGCGGALGNSCTASEHIRLRTPPTHSPSDASEHIRLRTPPSTFAFGRQKLIKLRNKDIPKAYMGNIMGKSRPKGDRPYSCQLCTKEDKTPPNIDEDFKKASEFYPVNKTSTKCVALRRFPRGVAAIFSFEEYRGQGPDFSNASSRLESTFRHLYFTVDPKKNLKSEEFKRSLQEIVEHYEHYVEKKPGKKQLEAVCIFVMAYGKVASDHSNEPQFFPGDVTVRDSGISLQWVADQFSDQKCPALRKRPKIIAFQLLHPDTNHKPSTAGAERIKLMNHSSTVVMYSFENDFLEKLCDELKDHAAERSLSFMINELQTKMRNIVWQSSTGDDVYFSPGLHAKE